jgi:hypothetical protein
MIAAQTPIMIPLKRRKFISILPTLSLALSAISILTATAFAEKVTVLPSWERTLAAQRRNLESFQLEMRTYRFDVREATRKVRFSEGERLFEEAANLADQARTGAGTPEVPLETLIQSSREVFGLEPSAPQVEIALHRRDSELDQYQVWEKNAGDLSIFDRRGSWQQGGGEISIGPPAGRGEIEVYLAKLGLFVPEFAVAEFAPDTTPENESGVLVYLGDWEGLRFRFGCEPWQGHGLVTTIEESPYWEGVEQGVWEKRRWFASGAPRQASGEASLTLPSFGLEVRYDSEGAVAFWAVSQPIALTFDKNEWVAFPRERPPFGWSVLDYRFKPEREYRFGYYR